MAAGIVASTLRRKAFHRRLLDGSGTRYQTVSVEPGHIAVSPADEGPGWFQTAAAGAGVSSISSATAGQTGTCPGFVGFNRSASLASASADVGPIAAAGSSSAAQRPATPPGSASSSLPPRGAQLCRVDFWPNCSGDTAEANLKRIQLETFDTLLPRANIWLAVNASVIRLVKCETIEQKVASVEEIGVDNVLFTPPSCNKNGVMCVKGLRLWYVLLPAERRSVTSSCTSDLTSALAARVVGTTDPPAVAGIEIGYMNVIPKCSDRASGKYPVYENLPETYAAINEYLTGNPLEGRIVTIETVPIKLSKADWKNSVINADQTCFPDEYTRHVLYITRIFFIYGVPATTELIGAQDFLPDVERTSRCYNGDSWNSLGFSRHPKCGSLFGAMRKVKEWLHSARNISVTNIQTLQAPYRKRPGLVHTGINFIDKSEHCPMIRFVRVTYVRSVAASDDDVIPTTADRGGDGGGVNGYSGTERECCRAAGARCSPSRYATPQGLSYKTILPAPVKIAMCSGEPQYETLTSTLERTKHWLKLVDRRVVGVETFYHPLQRIWYEQDGGESTVLYGEWTASSRNDLILKQRRPLVSVVRIYLDGEYREPPSAMLPPAPMVEEFNDCRCLLM